MGPVRGLSLIRGYYLGSPLFFLAGLWWGIEIRVTFIPDPGLRFGYYVLLSGLGLLTHFRPLSAPWVALSESSLNLLLIFLWILGPLYSVSDALEAGGAPVVPYTADEVLVNGLLAGSFFLLGFYRAQASILAGKPWLDPKGQRRGPGSR